MKDHASDLDVAGVSLLETPLRPGFERRVVVLRSGRPHPYSEDWGGAIVIIERGWAELVTSRGRRRRFPPGAVLWLDRWWVRALRNVDRSRPCSWPSPAAIVVGTRPIPDGD